METKFKRIMTTGFIVSLFIGLGACAKDSSNSEESGFENILEVGADGTTILHQAKLGYALSENLSFSETELDILLHMKEEEKLARDVYTALYEKWGIRIFSNISRAEYNHMNAVIMLLQNYGEEYTWEGEPGKFSNSAFQELYGQLTAKGFESLEEAYKTGALIEDMDIKDLKESIDKVANENIKMVFENLLKGSRNHLRAFNRQIVKIGLTYSPVYITQEEFDQIINSPNETGNGSQQNGNGRKGKRNRNGW